MQSFVSERMIQDLIEKVIHKVDSLEQKLVSEYKKGPGRNKQVAEIIQKCHYLIERDMLKEVFVLLKEQFSQDVYQINDILILKNRWTKNENAKKRGESTMDRYTQENSRIIQSLLGIISTLQES